MYFIDVILPIPLKQAFTYSVNEHEAHFLSPGFRVAVPFGKSKVTTGIVLKVHSQAPQTYQTKDIEQILDDYPIVTPTQISHWQWIAAYYMCSLGEVMRAALPGAFLLESETILVFREEHNVDPQELTEEQQLVYEALQHRTELHINDLRSLVERKNVLKLIDGLIAVGLISTKETIYEQFVPKKVFHLHLAPQYNSELELRELLDTMNRAPKQKEMLMHLFMLKAKSSSPITPKQLQEACDGSSAVLKSLVDKGIIIKEEKQVDRLNFDSGQEAESKGLTQAQLDSLEAIKQSFTKYNTTLFHGVTSSGKTEVYVKLIEAYLAQGKQVLYMLPEIALTTQLISRLERYFGGQVSVYHSKYSVHERIEVWNNVLNKQAKAQLILGARSTLFLPFSNLGLIIVDEEHEPSFKQYSPAPRYHARDAAIVLGSYFKAKIILGSATPALETYYNTQQHKFGLVSLNERYGKVLMPEISLIDIKEKYRKKRMQGHFSDTLVDAITETLSEGEQVILFQNRRGFAPIVECLTCGISPQCPNCDVSLTYHKHKGQLRCHYCGYNTVLTPECTACGSPTLDTKGFGTEQLETELNELFPEVPIARMDQDTTRGKNAYAKLIHAFEAEEIRILVGTQMLAKGLDFRKVGLVGVLKADSLLNFPDFRAHERSFQLLLQVAGRAGRTQKRGKVLIQTFNPYHQILQQVSQHDYAGMLAQELEQRYTYKYPPYYRTIRFTFKHRNFNKNQTAAHWFAQALKNVFKELVLGPELPPVGRIRNEFITHVLLKIPKEQALGKTKEVVHKIERNFLTHKEFSRIKLIIDVDPY